MENNNEFKIEEKHKLAFGISLFFILAPFFGSFIKNQGLELNADEFRFIGGYKKLANINLFIMIVATGLSVFNYYNHLPGLNYITTGMLYLIIGIILVSTFMIFSNKYIFQGSNGNVTNNGTDFKKIQSGNTNILLFYLPVYNFWVWYNENIELKSYWWLKESIIFWSLFIFFTLGADSPALTVVLISLGIIRVGTLLGGIDLINDKIKENLDLLLEKNLEEIWGFIKGSIIYLFHKMKNPGAEMLNSMPVYVNKYKKEYEKLNPIFSGQIIIEYVLVIGIIAGGVWYYGYTFSNIYSFINMFPIVVLLGRYLVLISNGKLPYVPIIHEIVGTIRKLINF